MEVGTEFRAKTTHVLTHCGADAGRQIRLATGPDVCH